MKIKAVEHSTAVVELTADEISTLNNALNEVCNGIHLEEEFDTRMGCSTEEARSLLSELNQLGRTMKI